VTTSESFERSIVSSAVISLVVEAIARRFSAARSYRTSPVLASMRIADGALSAGGRSSVAARAGAAAASSARTTRSASAGALSAAPRRGATRAPITAA
jgi:hypothetical protein